VDDVAIVPLPAKDDFFVRLEISCCEYAEREGIKRAEDGVGSAAVPKVAGVVTSLADEGPSVSATSLADPAVFSVDAGGQTGIGCPWHVAGELAGGVLRLGSRSGGAYMTSTSTPWGPTAPSTMS
jgi:hypothetical protein